MPSDVGSVAGVRDVYVKNLYLKSSSKIHVAFQRLSGPLNRFAPNVIILQDGVKILSNYLILLSTVLDKKKIVWYTHGENRQAENGSIPSKIIERIRLGYLKRGAALIAYSRGVKDRLVEKGIPGEKVFVARNTLDVDRLFALHHGTKTEDLQAVRNQLGLQGKMVITFIGRFVPEKKVDCFLELFAHLQKAGKNDIAGLLIGKGPLLEKYRKQAGEARLKNVRFLGAMSLSRASKYLMLSDFVFVPGMTGLAIVHAFSFGVPYVTLDLPIHSPEIEYLRPGENGLLLSTENYKEKISALLSAPDRLARMKKAAKRTAAEELHPDAQFQGFLQAIRFALTEKQGGAHAHAFASSV